MMPTLSSQTVVIKTAWEGRLNHDDVIKWKYFPRCWPFVRGIQRSPVTSLHKGPWRRALMFSLISTWINDWVNNREDGDLRRHLAHYDVIVMIKMPSYQYRNSYYKDKTFIRGILYQERRSLYWDGAQMLSAWWQNWNHNISYVSV